MTKQEALSKIREWNKPYTRVDMKQSTFSVTLRNIELGICKPKTELEFFKKMGFTVFENTTYEQEIFDPSKF